MIGGGARTRDRMPVGRLAWGAVAVVMAISLGAIGIHGLYRFSWLTSLYAALALVTTAGDTRVVPVTPGETIFAVAMLAVGTAVWIYWVSVVAAALVAVDLSRKERRMEQRLRHLSDHYVVVGAGRVGSSVMRQLAEGGASVVVVDTEGDRVAALEAEAEGSGPLLLRVGAYDRDLFHRLRLDRARGLALALPDDAQNLFAFLAARDVHPDIRVVARAQTQESAHHLRQLGVQDVVLPDLAGGNRIGRMLLKPRAHEVIMAMLDEAGIAVHEVAVDPGHAMEGQEVRRVRDAFGSSHTLLGYWRSGATHLAPAAGERIRAGDVLVLLEQSEDSASGRG